MPLLLWYCKLDSKDGFRHKAEAVFTLIQKKNRLGDIITENGLRIVYTIITKKNKPTS